MGWFENSGVPKSEVPNGYRLGSALDAEVVRKKQFERWGEVQNRRGEERVRVPNPVKVVIVMKNSKVEGTARDVSPKGMRAQVLEETSLRNKDAVKVQVFDPKGGSATMELDAQVMWMEKAGKTRAVWNVGFMFPNATPEQQKKLQSLALRGN